MNGGDGVWASVYTEGAAIGHACSCLIVMNLIRLGNTKVLKKYNCQYFRKAAINVTRITTGYDPPTKQPIYGERALDFVFDVGIDKFDLAEFFWRGNSSTYKHVGNTSHDQRSFSNLIWR